MRSNENSLDSLPTCPPLPSPEGERLRRAEDNRLRGVAISTMFANDPYALPSPLLMWVGELEMWPLKSEEVSSGESDSLDEVTEPMRRRFDSAFCCLMLAIPSSTRCN